MSVPAFDVIVCGSLHLDIVVRASELPRIDETAVGRSWSQVCGGKGGNQAVRAAGAGARTAMIGRVGADGFGERLREGLRAGQVDASGVGEDRAFGSGISVAIVKDDGDYGAVIVSGANLAIDAGSVRRDWDRLGGARVLILQNEVPEEVNVAAARAARADGAKVVLNAAPARLSGPDLMACVDVLVVNRVEAELLFGRAVADRDDVVALLAAPAAACSIVVTPFAIARTSDPGP